MKITRSGFFSLCTVLLLGAFLSCSKSDKPAPPPVAEFEVPAEIKAGVEVIFVNKSTNANTFTWQINGTNVDPSEVTTEGNLKATFASSGTYTIALTATKGNVTNTKTRSITVGLPSMPVAGFRYERVNPNFILPQYKFTDTSKNATVSSWNFYDYSQSNNVQNPVVTYYRLDRQVTAKLTVTNEAGYDDVLLNFNTGVQPNHIASYTFNAFNIYEDFSKNGKTLTSSSPPVSEGGVNGKGQSGKFTAADTTYAKPPEYLLNGAFAISNQISVSMWVKVSDLNVQGGILGLANTSFDFYIPAIFYANNKLYGRWAGNQNYGHIASQTITADTWYHIVLNGDGNTGKHEMFVNGVSAGITNDAVSFGSDFTTLHKAYLGWAKTQGWPEIGQGPAEKYFSGNISAVRFFNRIVSQEEVIALYHEFD